MTDYAQMKVDDLRAAAKEAGWKGAGRYDASKDELLSFLNTGTKPPSRAELLQTIAELRGQVEELKAVSVPEKRIVRDTTRTQGQAGRPAEPLPIDRASLLKCFRDACHRGQPFYRTGKKGVFSRRQELPGEWQGIGRDRLERLLAEMIQGGELVQEQGRLSVPDNVGEYQE